MRYLLTFLLLLNASVVLGANWYVATNGNNSSSGTTTNAPFLTIGKAVSVAVGDDVIHVDQGIYNEFVTNTTSGTAGHPITFVGKRDANGNWLTVIDPSTPLTAGTSLPNRQPSNDIGAAQASDTNSAAGGSYTFAQ